VSAELGRIRARTGQPLIALTRRFSAIDARYVDYEAAASDISRTYHLSDQLRVEPVAALADATHLETVVVEMTPEEVAVALSHIAVWRLIAAADVAYTLVLEDDAYFRRGFARVMDSAWCALSKHSEPSRPVDLLYVSYSEAEMGAKRSRPTGLLRRPDRGIWQLSGYVLSRTGAQRLLAMLPVRGPIDLWLNLKFEKLDVLMTARPLIEQRPSLGSSNAYSILPVLSQLGVLTREKPAIFAATDLPRPVVAYGDPGSGLTSLAAALSILGYRCCSDIDRLPADEEARLLAGRKERTFDAYVNVGSLGPGRRQVIGCQFGSARFIRVDAHAGGSVDGRRALIMPAGHPDKWELLSSFLGCEYPALPYPSFHDLGQRQAVDLAPPDDPIRPANRLRWDTSPWIVPDESWPGLRVARVERQEPALHQDWTGRGMLQSPDWFPRTDTFPSNLALFRDVNASPNGDDSVLTLRRETTAVRAFTSAALASKARFQYGRFAAELLPPKGSGLVTGIFLHRNGPRQEIDIELLGKDPTRLLANVFFNPGGPGTKLEYGYRGTPTILDLGFDASQEFHVYEIDWQPDAITWSVDGVVVHRRKIWQPTPIPDQPLEFNINLWHSRSTELAGKLDALSLPARILVRRVSVHAERGLSGGSNLVRASPSTDPNGYDDRVDRVPRIDRKTGRNRRPAN
jgi:GR25 family glycosyltransferase involved in LPS biosynthesis